MYPKFKYENIASVSMSLGGMAFMLIAFSVVIATLSLESWIFYVWNLRAGAVGVLDFSGKLQIVLCIMLILLVNAAAFYLPMRIGKKKLQEYTEII
jgi:hypothetical protein